MSTNRKINELALYLQWKSTRAHESFHFDVLPDLYNSCFDVCLRRASIFFQPCNRKVNTNVTADSLFSFTEVFHCVLTQGKRPKRCTTAIKEVTYRQYDGVGDKHCVYGQRNYSSYIWAESIFHWHHPLTNTASPAQSCLFSPLTAALARDPCHRFWVSFVCSTVSRSRYAGSKSVLRNDPTEKPSL